MKPWMQYPAALGFFGGLLIVPWDQFDPILTKLVNRAIPPIGLVCALWVVVIHVRTAWEGLRLGRAKRRATSTAAPAPAPHLATE